MHMNDILWLFLIIQIRMQSRGGVWIHFQTIANEDTGREQLMLLGSQRVIVRHYLLAIGIVHFQNSATRK